jgi:hypothetical protein
LPPVASVDHDATHLTACRSCRLGAEMFFIIDLAQCHAALAQLKTPAPVADTVDSGVGGNACPFYEALSLRALF